LKPLDRRARKRGGAQTPTLSGSLSRAIVVVPFLNRKAPGKAVSGEVAPRSIEAKVEEAIGLARAIDLAIANAGSVSLSAIRPATYLGKGKVEEFAGIVRTHEAGLVFVDASLTPVQQRNLEKAWNAKVVDRTGLILEIFGERAHTREGTLQVEHAHLTYQKSRLVRSWTHLERQRGGFGFLGGPGETQIEADRRMIGERISKLEREIAKVKRTRSLHRENRKRVPYPIVALVGYTNAGKSTLFNTLTKAAVRAQDLLFATLDPTLRAVDLPHGPRIIVSDTVGFISELPTMLIAAFRATLEEVVEADIVVHVRDVSHGDTEAQASDVTKILRELGIDPNDHGRIIEVWNKIDRLDRETRAGVENIAARRPPETRPVLISAITGEGMAALVAAIETRINANRTIFSLEIDAADGASLSWLHRQFEVLERTLTKKGRLRVRVRVEPGKTELIRRKFPDAVALAA
jgi:GTP-binding protein HflX